MRNSLLDENVKEGFESAISIRICALIFSPLKTQGAVRGEHHVEVSHIELRRSRRLSLRLLRNSWSCGLSSTLSGDSAAMLIKSSLLRKATLSGQNSSGTVLRKWRSTTFLQTLSTNVLFLM